MKPVKDMTLEELEARNAEIIASLENEPIESMTEERANEVLAEVNEIQARKAEFKAAEEARQELRNQIAAGTADATEIKNFSQEERSMAATNTVNRSYKDSPEYIEAFARRIKTGRDEEVRAIMTVNADNGQIPVPTFIDGVVRRAWDEDGIMKLVKKTYLAGNVAISFEIDGDDAHWHDEGAGPVDEENLYLGIVNMIPKMILKWVTITRETIELNTQAFLEYIYTEISYRIAKAASDKMIAKIEACGTASTTSSPAVPVVEEATIAKDTIAKALGELASDADPVIAMNRSTYAAFKAVEYAGNYAKDIFENLPVVYNNTIKSYSAATSGQTYAIVGDFGKGGQANIPNNNDIYFIYDEVTLATQGQVKVIGQQLAAIEVVAPKMFVKITK